MGRTGILLAYESSPGIDIQQQTCLRVHSIRMGTDAKRWVAFATDIAAHLLKQSPPTFGERIPSGHQRCPLVRQEGRTRSIR